MHGFQEIFGQQPAMDDLTGAFLADRLPHGMIFAGPKGVGKGTTAKALAKLFLCEKPVEAKACNRCESCRLFDAGNHADYHRVYRQLARLDNEKLKARDLTVDVIRDFLVAPANHKPAMGRGKFFVIEEAELMNAAAQNALLKTLEEPYGRTAVVLLTDQPTALLATIRSRCRIVRFAPLERALVVRELQRRGVHAAMAANAAELAEGSLGEALQWIEDGVVGLGNELRRQLDQSGAAQALPAWFKSSAEAYAVKQLEQDERASKDQATREGLAVYLRIAANHFRSKLKAAGNASAIEKACDAIEAIVNAEQLLDANVNVPIVFQQLAVTLDR